MAVRGINKVILVGRLGKDPEVRYIPNGGAVANLQVATSESWRGKQTGEMREQQQFSGQPQPEPQAEAGTKKGGAKTKGRGRKAAQPEPQPQPPEGDDYGFSDDIPF